MALFLKKISLSQAKKHKRWSLASGDRTRILSLAENPRFSELLMGPGRKEVPSGRSRARAKAAAGWEGSTSVGVNLLGNTALQEQTAQEYSFMGQHSRGTQGASSCGIHAVHGRALNGVYCHGLSTQCGPDTEAL